MGLGTSAETNVSADVLSVTAQIDFTTNCDVSTNFSKIQKYELRFPSQYEQYEAPCGPVLRSHRVTGYNWSRCVRFELQKCRKFRDIATLLLNISQKIN